MRLIDADELIEQMEADGEHIEDSICKLMHYALIRDIKRQPTIDTKKELICSVTVDTDEIIERIKESGWTPVKHGRWIYYEDETIEDGGRCSICQCDQPVFWEDWTWKFVETDYCPNCGARMDGGKDGAD